MLEIALASHQYGCGKFFQQNQPVTDDRLPPNTIVFNEHQPFLGHIEQEITRTDVHPFTFRTYQMNCNTHVINVKNCDGKSQSISATIENGAGYEFIERKTPGATYELLEGIDGINGIDYEIESNQEGEFWIRYKYNERTEGKVMEVMVEMISEGQGRKFYLLYLRGKQKKLKKMGEKFIRSCDEFWELETGSDQEALKRRILFIRATPVED